MAANLSNIAFFDISEDQFKNFIPGGIFKPGQDYYTYSDSDIQGDDYLSTICNFAIQIDVDKKITLGRLGEFFMKSPSFWNLLNKRSDSGQGVSWYEALKTTISNIETLIGPQDDVSDSWDWNDIILKYNNLIELIYNITGIIGGLGDSNTPSENYKTWNTWNPFNQEPSSGQDILGSIQSLYTYLTNILGSDWFDYSSDRGGLNQRVTELENYTGIPVTGSSGQTSLKKQIEDINTALGKKSDPSEDTIYKRLDDLEKRLYLEDDTLSINMSTDVYAEPIQVGGNWDGESLINYSTVYALFTKTPYVLEPNKRYILNITGASDRNNNLKASFKSQEPGVLSHYGLSSVNEAPFISCDLSNLVNGSRVRIECPTHYLLVGVMFNRTVIVLKGSNSETHNPNTPTIYISGFQGESNYSGLDVSSRIFCENINEIPMGGWIVDESPLDLTRTHITSNFEFNPGKSYIINDSTIPDIAKSKLLKFACPYYIDIEARNMGSFLHYFIEVTFETNPFIQHLFDSSD